MAIALDNAGAFDAGANLTTSYTQSYTNTAGTAMIVGVWTRYAGANTPPTGITYNGVSLTKYSENNNGGATFDDLSVWGLANPATGTHNIVVSLSGTSIRNALTVVTLTGTDTSSPFGNAGGNGGNGSPTSGSFSITTTRQNSVIVGVAQIDDTTLSVTGTNQTQRASINTAGGYQSDITTQTTTTTGVYTSSWSFTTASEYVVSGVEVKAPASAVNSGFLAFM